MKKVEEADSDFLLVPHDRIGAIIGKGGSTKREIERKTGTELVVDSEEGEIEITRKGTPLKYLKARSIVRAIARGFSPEKAFRLLEDGVLFELIELRELLGKNKSLMKAKKGRVIGAKGKAREQIETETGASISVYGRTIALIGKEDEIAGARKAIQLLLKGASHSTAYDYLKRGLGSGKFEL